MATSLVSTGQITIIDQNDAKPITAFISANTSLQTVYTKNDTSETYIPNWASSSLELTPKIYVGGVGTSLDLSSNTVQITNRKWTRNSVGGAVIYDGGTTTQDETSFTTTSPFTVSANGIKLTISQNLKPDAVQYPIYFECDYVDPTTGLITHIVTSVTLSLVKTGTNAVFINIRGQNAIEKSTGQTKAKIAICADLVRSSGVDRDNLTYKWYNATTGTAVQITDALATLYSITDTATTAVPAAAGSLGTNLPAAGAGNTYNASGVGNGNTLTISENAINDVAVFKVDITDSEGDSQNPKTYTQYFTVYDLEDPYDVRIVSNTGDKLPNGVGNTTLTPQVFYGGTPVSNLAGWEFDWILRNKAGAICSFINPNVTGWSWSGIPIKSTGNSYDTSSKVLTLDANPGSFTIGTASNQTNLVKLVDVNNNAAYFTITNKTATSVTLSQFSSDFLISSIQGTTFNGGKLYHCFPDVPTTGVTRTTNTDVGIGITVYGEDVESKAVITCNAKRPD